MFILVHGSNHSSRMEQGWLTAADAAKWLGVGQPTLYRLMHDGAIPCSKVGRAYRIRETDLEAYVDAHHVKPGTLSHLNPPRADPGEAPHPSVTARVVDGLGESG